MGTIKGLDACLSKLMKLQDISQPEKLETAIQDAEQYAKSLARVRTGELKNSIKFEAKNIGNATEIAGKASALHAIFNEYGTSKMPAQPFMRPAMEKLKNDIDEILKDNIKEVAK